MDIPISTENRPGTWYNAGMANTDGDYEVRPFGEALKYLRDRAKLTQRQIATMMEMGNTSTLSDWERRIDAPNKPYELERLATILGVDVDDLAAGRVPKPEAVGRELDDVLLQKAREHHVRISPNKAVEYVNEFFDADPDVQLQTIQFLRYLKWQHEHPNDPNGDIHPTRFGGTNTSNGDRERPASGE